MTNGLQVLVAQEYGEGGVTDLGRVVARGSRHDGCGGRLLVETVTSGRREDHPVMGKRALTARCSSQRLVDRP